MALLDNNTEGPHYYRPYGRPAAFAFPTDDVGVLEVAGIAAPEGLVYPEQKAYFCAAAWCEQGGFLIRGRGWEFMVKAGEVGVLDTDVYFEVHASVEGCKVYYLLMDGPACGVLLKESGIWRGVFPYRSIPVDWLEWVAAGMTNSQNQQVVAHAGHNMFMKVAQQAREACPEPMLWEAQCCMQHEWGDLHMNVDALVDRLGVSRSKLHAVFKKYLDITPGQYLNEIRLYNARRLLEESTEAIADIACRCGLPNASYFTRWFRRHTGRNPSDFREVTGR